MRVNQDTNCTGIPRWSAPRAADCASVRPKAQHVVSPRDRPSRVHMVKLHSTSRLRRMGVAATGAAAAVWMFAAASFGQVIY